MSHETFDVVIVGAGIAGIGTACHLQRQRPGTSFVILDAQDAFGGTWLTNRYPGARSDSDLHTYGYSFKPWMGAPIATRAEILSYMREVIEEHDLARHIRHRHKVGAAAWSSVEQAWSLTVTHAGATQHVEARFLAMCQGYYHHWRGYTPDWPGFEDYLGKVVHPQCWPADLDVAGKSIIVIGSGATAATLIPVLAETSGPVTMLQRSPTYYLTTANANPIVDELRRLEIDPAWIHEIARRKSLADEAAFIRRTFEEPDAVKAELIAGARAILGPDYDLATHFTPSYRPWQQRVAYVPGGDFFQAIRDGKVTVVTEEIEGFTETAVVLKSGRRLQADLLVTATGFDLCILGDIGLTKDGQPVDVGGTVNYRGMMLSGVPNLMWTFGYLRASWTMRVDMNCDFLCRLLQHMSENGFGMVTPELLADERELPRLPWVDPKSFNAGYIMRSLDLLPKRIDRREWQHLHDYWAEKDEIPRIDLEDGRLVYSG